jgi:hypothetical protein
MKKLNTKGKMKKLLMGLSLIVLLAGCASQDRDNDGMGGTSDQFNNNATQGTGSNLATNSATGEKMNP